MIRQTALVFALFPGLMFPAPGLRQSAFEFDVASIKPVKESDSGGQRFRNTPGSLEVLNMEPTTMIRNAYRLAMEGQLTGFPAWADHDCFNIEAKAEEDPATELGAARARNLLRLQSLLATRFQLRTHWERRKLSGYVLAAGRHGPKMKLSEPGSAHRTQQGRGKLLCERCSMAALASFLSNFLERPVQDDTGIQGEYDFNFAFEPLNATASSDEGLPSLFSVLKDQLGLDLKPKDLAVQTLVVDHIERPSSN